jgi:hypothetical protein
MLGPFLPINGKRMIRYAHANATDCCVPLQLQPQRVLYGHGIDVGVRRWLLVPSVSSAVQSAYFVVRKRETILPCFILQEPLAYPHTSPCVIVNRYKWIQNRPEMPNEWIYCTD